jgi:hypothetical protein
MMLACSRALALVFAVSLGVGETVINWGHWQFAPLWIVDYIIAGWLLWGIRRTRSGHHGHVLLSGWAFAAGVFYMALFTSLDPESSVNAQGKTVLLSLIGVMFALSVAGFLCALLATPRRHSPPANDRARLPGADSGGAKPPP